MTYKSVLALLAGGLPLLAAGHAPNLPGHPAADSGVEQFSTFWRRYLDSDAYARAVSGEGPELMFSVPADPDDKVCAEQLEPIERLLIEHPPYPLLHDVARRCHLLRGETADADIHRAYIAAWHAVMCKDGDGSSETALLWAATVQDARHYLEYRGERVIDTEYRIADSGERILYLVYTESAAGRDEVRYFDGTDIILSVMKAHQRLGSSGFRLAELAWSETYGNSTALLWLAANKDPGAAIFFGDLIAAQGLDNRNNLESALLSYLWAAENSSAIGATRFARTVFRYELVDLQKDAVKRLASAADAHYCDAVITLLQVDELRLARKSRLPDLTAPRRRCAEKSPGGGFEYRIAASYFAGKGKLRSTKRAFHYWRQAAAQGHRDGKWRLARAYLSGWGTVVDPAAGLALLHELAAADDMDAVVDMGYYLARHPEYQKQYGLPYEYDARAAAAGEKVGQYNLAVALHYGQGGAQVDTERALYWYRQSAAQGDSSAQRALAELLLTDGRDEDVQEGVGLMHAAAEQGDAQAQNLLGSWYETGRGVGKDLVRARYWYLQAVDDSVAAKINYHLAGFRRAAPLIDDDRLLEQIYTRAKNGDPEALTALVIYRKHRFLSGDYKPLADKALNRAMKMDYAPAYYVHDAGTVAYRTRASTKAPRWSLKNIARSAELGYPYAHLLLAEYYGNFVEMNNDEKAVLAFNHYSTAAEAGINRAMYQLAHRYENGIGTAADMERAYYWYHKAAENGVTAAKNDIAALLLNGKGTDKDPAAAVKWLEEAANDGVALAMRNLGHLYKRGAVVERNIEVAFNWYLKASEKKDIVADLRLGEMLIVEPEFGHNTGLAKIYLEDAANNGNTEAAFWLARAYEIEAEQAAAGDDEATAEQIEAIYRFAADRGSAPALNNLAIRYLKSGKGSTRKGRRLLEQAAESGNKIVLANLAYCYEHGLGSKKDFNRALALYRESAAAGSPFALKRLSDLYGSVDSELFDPVAAADYARRLGKALLDYYTLIATSSMIDPLESNDGRTYDYVEPGIS